MTRKYQLKSGILKDISPNYFFLNINEKYDEYFEKEVLLYGLIEQTGCTINAL